MPYNLCMSVFGAIKGATSQTKPQVGESFDITWRKSLNLLGIKLIPCVGVEPTGIYPLNRKRLPEYFYCTSDTSESINSVAGSSQNISPVCIPSTSVTGT
jgi:hypothetical protein